MEIANPIYDVVFKYMLEDNKVAKLFLSTLTGMDIIDLELLPQEVIDSSKEKPKLSLGLTIYRLDFSAKIHQKDGSEKVIIIELQKSKTYAESMRFRKYLGKQYMNDKLFKLMTNERGRKVKMGLPIFSIYFLGESIVGMENTPVIHIQNRLLDRYSGQSINIDDDFINSLYHEGIIVNISALKKKRRDELEILLSIFDQQNRTKNIHVMNILEQEIPEKFRPIIRRLQAAAQVKEVKEVMELEDDFAKELLEYEERLQKAEIERDNERKLKEVERKLKEEERKLKEDAVWFMIEYGIDKQAISEKLGLSLSEIEDIQKRKMN
jgi:hypothetical protein